MNPHPIYQLTPDTPPPGSHISGLRHDADDYEARIQHEIARRKLQRRALGARGRKVLTFFAISAAAAVAAVISIELGGA